MFLYSSVHHNIIIIIFFNTIIFNLFKNLSILKEVLTHSQRFLNIFRKRILQFETSFISSVALISLIAANSPFVNLIFV